MMNKRVIIIAHVVVIGIFVLVGGIAAQQTQNSNTQNSNQNSARQNRNANRNANSSSSRNMNTGQSMSGNANMNSNSNMSGNMNAGMAGGNMNAGGQTGSGGPAPAFTSSDQKFVMEAAMGGMAEVELGRLAAERGSSDAVKQFGQRMVDDHSRANTELTQLTSARGLNVPTALDDKHRAQITKMSQLSGAAFDNAYAKEMLKDHQKDVSLFQKQSTRGADGDLRAFAAKTLPTLQEHLSMARALNGHGGMTHGNMNGNGNMNRSNSNSGNSNR